MNNLRIEKGWMEGQFECKKILIINSTPDVQKIMKGLENLGEVITYFVPNPYTPWYYIYEIKKDGKTGKKIKILGKNLAFESKQNEWRELLDPSLSEFLDELLSSVETKKENLADKVAEFSVK